MKSSFVVALLAFVSCAGAGSPEPVTSVPNTGTAAAASASVASPIALRAPIRVVDDFVSMFVIPVGADGAILVDCGMDPEGKALTAALRDASIDPARVSAIFITHRHADHVGACARFPSAKVYAFPDVEGQGPAATVVEDGKPVQVDGAVVTPFFVPGHTRDSGAYLVGDVLYLGDAGVAVGPGEVKGSTYVFAGSDRRRDEEHQNAKVLRQLHARLLADRVVVRRLAFAHSDPVDDVSALARAE